MSRGTGPTGWRTSVYDRQVRPATCRRGGCSLAADPATPGGEWCAVHGAQADQRRAVAASGGTPSKPFRGARG